MGDGSFADRGGRACILENIGLWTYEPRDSRKGCRMVSGPTFTFHEKWSSVRK
jgi:hypothetical protein